MLAPGTRIGRWTVEERIGSGDRSEVYRGRDDLGGRAVAIKLLRGHDERDRREADAVARLQHPNIVPRIAVLEHEGRLCLVHAWAPGGSLEAELGAHGRLDLRGTLNVGRDVAAALAYAHGQGVLHRDLKPSNVLRDATGSYQLVDLGLVGRLDPDSGLTSAGQIVGTPLYMSPEQVTGAPQGPSTDLFGLGLLLFRCLHGRLPDEGSDGTYGLMLRRVSEPIVVPNSPLQGLISQCLAVDPAARPRSAEEVIVALDRVAAYLAAEPEAAPVIADTVASAPPGATRPSPAPTRPRTAPRQAGVVGGLVVVAVVLILAVALVVEWRSALLVLVGCAIAGLSVVAAIAIRRRWSSRLDETDQAVTRVLPNLDDRVDLTRSLMFEVDQFVGTLRTLDQKILGTTILVMLKEYEDSKSSQDRQAALVHVVNLMEKVQARRAPWYVRQRDVIATAVAVVGCLAGLVTAVVPLVR